MMEKPQSIVIIQDTFQQAFCCLRFLESAIPPLCHDGLGEDEVSGLAYMFTKTVKLFETIGEQLDYCEVKGESESIGEDVSRVFQFSKMAFNSLQTTGKNREN